MRILLIIFFLTLSTVSADGQVANSSFENWTTLTNFSHPEVLPAKFSSVNELSAAIEGNRGVKQVVTENTGLAIRLETLEHGGDTLCAYGIFGNLPQGDSIIFSGGFPFTDPNVTGISMDVRYDINPLSPGFVMVQFLSNGAPLSTGPSHNGTFLFPFQGVQNQWTTISFDFAPEADQIPDECVIAFASNDLFGDAAYHVGDWLEIDNIEFLGTEENEVPGGDFESWEEVQVQTADDWQSIDAFFNNAVDASNISFDGDLALELTTKNVDNIGEQAMVFQAEIIESGFLPNQALAPTSYALQFRYKFFSPSIAEKAKVYLYLSEVANPAPGEMFFVETNLIQTDGWVLKNLDFSQVMPNANYYGLVFFSGSGLDEPGTIGSRLLVDDVEFLTQVQDCDFIPFIAGGNDTICANDNITLSTQIYENWQWFVAEGDNDFTVESQMPVYSMNGAEAGTYQVFLYGTLAGCTATSDTVTIVVEELPSPTIIEEAGSLVTEAGMASYNWVYNDSPVEGSAQSIEIIDNGIYTVFVENAEGCMAESESYTVTGVGVEELSVDISFYPNPVVDQFTIRQNHVFGGFIEVFNLAGEVVMRKTFDESYNHSIDVQHLSAGNYIVKYWVNDESISHKIVILP